MTNKFERYIHTATPERYYCRLAHKKGRLFKCPWGLQKLSLEQCQNCKQLEIEPISSQLWKRWMALFLRRKKFEIQTNTMRQIKYSCHLRWKKKFEFVCPWGLKEFNMKKCSLCRFVAREIEKVISTEIK